MVTIMALYILFVTVMSEIITYASVRELITILIDSND